MIQQHRDRPGQNEEIKKKKEGTGGPSASIATPHPIASCSLFFIQGHVKADKVDSFHSLDIAYPIIPFPTSPHTGHTFQTPSNPNSFSAFQHANLPPVHRQLHRCAGILADAEGDAGT